MPHPANHRTAINASSLPPLRAVLVDDEQPARQHLGERLDAHPGIEIVGEADSVESAAALIKSEKPDVVFLDIQLHGQTGFDLLPLLGDLESPPAVVFVTAYDKYAIEAFKVNALDYLLKPVSTRRLATTVERLENQRRMDAPPVADAPQESADPRPLEMGDLVLLREKRTIRMVGISEICAVEASGDYTHITLASDHMMIERKKLAHWEERLPEPPFRKISRRLLVNMERIKAIVMQERNRAELHLAGSERTIPVGRIELRRIRQLIE
ncbi:MAG: response regulator [Chthoniobacterales bacterium]|nr:response regulator [Chthoniobacterales bacterium]